MGTVGIVLALALFLGCSPSQEPPISVAEALAIGIVHAVESEPDIVASDLYVSNGVLRYGPDDPFGWEAIHSVTYEPRAFEPSELAAFEASGIVICELDTEAEEVFCPGLGDPGKRASMIFGGRPSLKEDGESWWVPVVLLQVSREETTRLWVHGVLIDIIKPIPPSAEFAAQYAPEAIQG